MSNDILIKNFEDNRWMQSEVFQELLKIAREEMVKEAGRKEQCVEDEEDKEEEKDEESEDVMYCKDLCEKHTIEDVKRACVEKMNSFFKQSENLFESGDIEDAIRLEKEAYAISRKIDELVKNAQYKMLVGIPNKAGVIIDSVEVPMSNVSDTADPPGPEWIRAYELVERPARDGSDFQPGKQVWVKI